ncbi:hypothetical protein [Mesorhizobium helmanticense]|uniref:Uncharacterized protein n=1 Tax=Mesorhizobium helmanticense TaxID=1776423 RepID=A0A2T4INB3_9HYPH|nr:hypothetical protein [Mesorhizobium helmanticense]PTE07132.1 hypothetical protein C9427_27850 [Mesorhizobium helmanticense]
MSLVRDAVELDAPLITPANAKESNTKEYCLTETRSIPISIPWKARRDVRLALPQAERKTHARQKDLDADR